MAQKWWLHTFCSLYLCSCVSLQRGGEFIAATLSRIAYFTSPEEAARSCDLVVEAIVENIGVKQELFARLDKACPRWVQSTCVTISILCTLG